MLAKKIGLIGAGRMATALARGFVDGGLVNPAAITASDPTDEARARFAKSVSGARVEADNRSVVSTADVVLLAVKPQQMSDVLAGLGDSLPPGALVVSIAAGVTIAKLAAGLPDAQRIVRVMPNTPCLVGCGASAYALGAHATAEDGQLVAQLLEAVGYAYEVPEVQLDAVTGLSGSGPAFVYTVIEALTAGGVRMGLAEELAAKLAVQTVAGAAQMVQATRLSPAELRDQVTSPGGTTLAGLAAMKEAGGSEAMIAAVEAATHRSRELGQS